MRSEHGVYLGMLITFMFSKNTCECVFTKLVTSTIPLELRSPQSFDQNDNKE